MLTLRTVSVSYCLDTDQKHFYTMTKNKQQQQQINPYTG